MGVVRFSVPETFAWYFGLLVFFFVVQVMPEKGERVDGARVMGAQISSEPRPHRMLCLLAQFDRAPNQVSLHTQSHDCRLRLPHPNHWGGYLRASLARQLTQGWVVTGLTYIAVSNRIVSPVHLTSAKTDTAAGCQTSADLTGSLSA